MPLLAVTNPARLNDTVNFPGLYQFIRSQPYELVRDAAGWLTDRPVPVQVLIDTFDPLAYAKADRIRQIKVDGLANIIAIFPALDSFDRVDLEAQRWQSLAAAAKSPTANYTKLINTYTAATTGIASVNAAATIAAVYAVVVTWP